MSSPALPAHAPEAERAIIASVLAYGSRAVDRCPGLYPRHFFSEAQRRTWEAALTLLGAGVVIDAGSVANYLRTTDQLKLVGGVVALAELVDAVPDQLEVLTHHARVVREKAALRDVALASAQWGAESRHDVGDVAAWLAAARAKLERIDQELAEGCVVNDEVTFQDALTALGHDLESQTPRRFVSTGVPDLDDILGGFEVGFVTIVGAPTNWGKSNLICMFADEAISSGKRVLVVTFEDQPGLYVQRLVARHSKLPAWNLKNNRLSGDEWSTFIATSCHFVSAQKAPVVLNAIGRPIELVVQRVARLTEQHRYDLIVFDYLTAARSIGHHESTRVRVNETLRKMIDVIKMSDGAAGIIVSQLNRDGAEEPKLSSLKESGDIEIGAEAVLLGHTVAGKLRLLLAKNKDGVKDADFELEWDARSASIRGGRRIGG